MAPGFAGGPCLRKDTLQLVASMNTSSPILTAILDSHEKIVEYVADAIVRRVADSDSFVVQLGLTFKPGSDDIRGSVALDLARKLGGSIPKFAVVDPYVPGYPEFQMLSLTEALTKADVLVVGTRHPQFRELDSKIPIIDVGGRLKLDDN